MKFKRIIASLFVIAVGIAFVVYGKEMTLRTLPLPWAGYLFIGTGILGLLGVNVFWGGPLDKRND